MADAGISGSGIAHERSPSSQTPLTKTCQNCATAKIKCTRNGDAPTCNRCHRLGKECNFRQARRRFYGNKNDNRIEQLEANLARVTELLDKQHQSEVEPAHPSAEPQLSLPIGLPQPGSGPHSARGTSVSSDHDRGRTIPVYNEDVVAQGLIDMGTAEQCLGIYRTSMLKHFPFVIPSPHLDAASLRHRHPCLFLAILSAATLDDFVLQRTLSKRFAGLVSLWMQISPWEDRQKFDPHWAFDLLQGILVYLAWNQYHPRPRRYSQFLSLAVALLIDLRLDRPPKLATWRTDVIFDLDQFGHRPPSVEATKKDRQRAVIGCYLLTSSISILLRKMSLLPFFPQIEAYSENLTQDPEYETDKSLATIVHLQRLWEKINDLQLEGYEETLCHAQSPLRGQISMLHTDLEHLGRSCGALVSSSHFLGITYYSARLYLEQICLVAREMTPNSKSSATEPWHVDLLRSALISASAIFQLHFSLAPRAERFITNFETTAVGFALILTPKLVVAAAEAPVRDATTALLHNLNFDDVLEDLISRTGSLIVGGRDEDGEPDVFFRFTQRVQAVKDWYARRPRTNVRSQMPSSEASHLYAVAPSGTEQYPASSGLLTEAEVDQMMSDWLSFPVANASFEF